MIRLWIEIIPQMKGDTDGYRAAKAMQKFFTTSLQSNQKVHTVYKNLKRPWLDFIKPKSVQNYLEHKMKFSKQEILPILNVFEINEQQGLRIE